MAHKSHKIALRVNAKQDAWFHSQCGYARFACNNALAHFTSGLASGKFYSGIDLNNHFNTAKKAYDWTKAQDQRAALYAIRNLTEGINRWKDKVSGFPKFKKRGHKRSYTTDEQAVRIDRKRIKLPKIGWVRMFQELRFGGFLSKLKSKAEVLGIPIIEAPQFFASSKTCSSCGYVKDELSLSERTYHCDWCDRKIDRDQNAAINLKKLAVGYTES